VLDKLRAELKALATPKKAKASSWFFKTGPGQYGEGDQFIGVTVPEQRSIAKKYRDLELADVETLLQSPVHEERLVALFILVLKFKRANNATREKIYNLYLARAAKYVNNWDLVDSSASYIVGAYLEGKPKDILIRLAHSENLWEKRIAMISTLYFIAKKDPKPTLEIAEILINDKHDLIQKAVGWMLREIGKHCSKDTLTKFLDKHAATMPRTALRYAIEHFSPSERQYYLQAKNNSPTKK